MGIVRYEDNDVINDRLEDYSTSVAWLHNRCRVVFQSFFTTNFM